MKRISVKGYKAINKEKTIDLTAINLFIGKNGSGKSSFINSLLLAKNSFKLDLSKDSCHYPLNSSEINKNILEKNILPNYAYSRKFNNRIINPFNSIGKFSFQEINCNSRKKEFSYSLPIELEFFKDKFDLELKYYLNENNNALLNGIKLINKVNNKELFSLQAINLEDIARKKTIEKNSNVHYTFLSILKIDIDYLLNFLTDLKKIIRIIKKLQWKKLNKY